MSNIDDDNSCIDDDNAEEINNVEVASGNAATEKRVRGTGFCAIEDFMICKAFMAASEDSVVGANQHGKDFKKQMHNSYKEILAAQLALDKTTYQSSSSSTRDALGLPLIYHQRTPDLIYTL